MSKNLENGDLVWAKMKGYPPWPGKITDPPKGTKMKKAHRYVFFYASNNYAWIHEDAIELHSQALVDKYTKGHKRPPSYLNAVQIIITASKNQLKSGKFSETRNSVNDQDDFNQVLNSKGAKNTLIGKEKKTPKKNTKRSSSVDQNLGPAKKQKTIKLSKSNTIAKRQNVSSNEKLTEDDEDIIQYPSKKQKKKEDQIHRVVDTDENNEVTKLIIDEIDEINASAPTKIDSPSEESKVKKVFREVSDEDHEVDKEKYDELLDVKEDEFDDTMDDQNTVTEEECTEQLIPKQRKKGEVYVSKKKSKELNTDELNHIENSSTDRQKSNRFGNRSIQRSIKIGLSKSQKHSGITLAQRRKNDEEAISGREKSCALRKAQKVKNIACSKRIINEVSEPSIKKKMGNFSNLVISEHNYLSETMADSNDNVSPAENNKPESPIDLLSKNEILKLKNVTPTKKKIGFLGLGSMGQRIVKNLLQSGHCVTVWNRTLNKCDNFIEAEKAQSVAEVVMACDLIFCCLANDAASKMVFFGQHGVASGLQTAAITGDKKGFIEMTTLDPETSKILNLEINLKGGRYLEAQLTGSKDQASEGNLLIVSAGDKSLFVDCQSCFVAIGKTSMLVSDQVGVASTYSSIHMMLYGSVYASLAEALALVESIGLEKETFIKAFMKPNVKSVVHLDKNHLMGQKDCPVNMPLMHVQKAINDSLKLGTTFAQPMHVNAAVNSVYKLSKLLKLDKCDISAVYKAFIK